MATRNEQLFDFLCRTCMHELVEASSSDTNPEQQWRSIFDSIEECSALRIAELLSNSIPQIEVELSDALPKKICCECLQQLQSVYRFQQMCRQSQQHMIELITKRKTNLEVTVIEASTLNGQITNEAFSVQDYLLDSKEFVSLKTLPEAPTTSADDPLESHLKNEAHDNDETVICLGNLENDALRVTEKENVSSTSPPYICAICGKSFTQSRYLKCHLKRHKERDAKKLQTQKTISSRKFLSKRKANLKSTIVETSVEDEKNINDKFSVQEYLFDSKEVVSVTNVPEAPTTSGDNPTESKGAAIDSYSPVDVDNNTKNEECDNDVSNDVYSDDETLTSLFTTKNDALPVTGKEKSNSASPPHICSICNKSFNQRRYLRNHLRRHKAKDEKKIQKQSKVKVKKAGTQQKTLRKYQCKLCDKCYKRPNALRNHVRTHTGERPFLCPECGKSFTASNNLKNHLGRHSDVKAYECPLCPKKFRCSSNLISHRKTHNAVKSHICDICGYAFMQAGMLKKHKRNHSGEKPYKCDFCGMRFVRADQQRRHIRIHTGEKPYKCKYCDCAYAQGNDLIKHLRIHLGDNIYRCELCPLAFRLVGERNLHIIEHKNEDSETRERNMKALNEANAKLQLKLAETICNLCNKSRCQ